MVPWAHPALGGMRPFGAAARPAARSVRVPGVGGALSQAVQMSRSFSRGRVGRGREVKAVGTGTAEGLGQAGRREEGCPEREVEDETRKGSRRVSGSMERLGSNSECVAVTLWLQVTCGFPGSLRGVKRCKNYSSHRCKRSANGAIGPPLPGGACSPPARGTVPPLPGSPGLAETACPVLIRVQRVPQGVGGVPCKNVGMS